MIDDWFDEHGEPSPLLRKVEEAIKSTLPSVLDADLQSGALFAARLREEVAPLLIPSSAWSAPGYAEESADS